MYCDEAKQKTRKKEGLPAGRIPVSRATVIIVNPKLTSEIWGCSRNCHAKGIYSKKRKQKIKSKKHADDVHNAWGFL
jgi:hypothetical protein